jgi:cruciform cutting endonuclease 1
MVPKPKTITAKALQALLTRIGSASSGIKATLQERFRRDIRIPRLVDRASVLENSTPRKSLRIMSIDMGIKNLAFCDSIVSYPEKGSLNASMTVMRWEKINLVPATTVTSSPPLDSNKISLDADEDEGQYSLSVLSRTAYHLIKDTILTANPDIILIEKQRWRSGGGSAIQQWTVRVNTFEGMLWAILRTLSCESHLSGKERDYQVFGVDPKRVGYYWLGQSAERLAGAKKASVVESTQVDVENDVSTKKKMSRTKMEKKAKIALLRSWLTPTSASTAPTSRDATPIISFTFDARAENSLRALISPSKSKQTRKKSKNQTKELTNAANALDIPETELKKLDDITDCFLQAAAWVSWESNRLQLKKVWDRKRGDDDTVPELGNEVLMEMVQEAGEG